MGGRWGQVNNVQNSDGSEWLQGGEGGEGEGIHRNWIVTAVISISVIRV